MANLNEGTKWKEEFLKINMTDRRDNADEASFSGQHQIITEVKQKDAESGESPIAAESLASLEFDIEIELYTTVGPLIIPPHDKDLKVITNVNQQIMASRQTAHQNLKKQAKRMTLASDAIHVPVEIGENIIPDFDRAKTDLPYIVGVVLQKDDQGFYKIGTKYGILGKLYCRSEFNKCKEFFLHEDDVLNSNLPLKTVAKESGIGTGQGFMRCLCKKGCMSKRCFCKKNGCLCNSKYHDSLSCNNK